MNKIVRQHYPAERLPPELREGLDPAAQVTITIEAEAATTKRRPTLEEIFARRQPPFLSIEEIDKQIREQRDEADD
jgi:hypothetical protein